LEIPLPQKLEVIIGREDPASNIFPDIDTTTYGGNLCGVSRRHARIVLQGNQYFIEDLNSVNSTFVNKIKLAPKQRFPLNDGDELILGRLKFTVRIG
ncbi:MAG: FHA domain-containing protein, partial [candidate division KSB1 bacterium]|nr:FHA domain-containing protein [candidate division KSB1 bacterium]